jgi:hypothetical protein
VDLDNIQADPVPYVNTSGPAAAIPFEIYRDTAMAIWMFEPPFTYADQLYYRIANLSTTAIAVIGWTEDDSFDTQISFKQAQDTSVITKLPLFAYPFDEVSNHLVSSWSEYFLLSHHITLVNISGREASLFLSTHLWSTWRITEPSIM